VLVTLALNIWALLITLTLSIALVTQAFLLVPFDHLNGIWHTLGKFAQAFSNSGSVLEKLFA